MPASSQRISLRVPRLPEEPGRHRADAGPGPGGRPRAGRRRPRAPTSSSSTPARSSTPPRRRASTRSSRWPSTRRAGAAKLVVTGCLAQRYADELVTPTSPEIDTSSARPTSRRSRGVLGARRRPRAGAASRCRVVQVAETPAYIYDHDAPRVRIGAARTRPTSRSPRAATGRARSASSPSCAGRSAAGRSTTSSPRSARSAADGVREINLIAQDLTRYGWDAGTVAGRAPDPRPGCCARSAGSTASTGSGSTTRSRARSTTS